MTPELTVLTLAALLQVGQLIAYSVAANMQVDLSTALGPRDVPITLSGTAARLDRALNNHFQGLTLFAIACIVISLADKSSPFTSLCAWVYLAARLAYVPAYVLGLSPWRSVVWMIGFGATTAMLIAAVL